MSVAYVFLKILDSWHREALWNLPLLSDALQDSWYIDWPVEFVGQYPPPSMITREQFIVVFVFHHFPTVP